MTPNPRDNSDHRLATAEGVMPAGIGAIVGRSPVMVRLRHLIESVARSDAPVLIAGETGSGKELVARAVHSSSHRRDQAFVAVNCGSLNENLMATELFGAERGAYTSSVTARHGLFQAANGGTLFLDEVGDMPSAMQTGLLRVLETSEIVPVGSTQPRKVDVRIVAASHRDLADLVYERSFREDLRYRLDVVRLDVPPLRERLEDLPELCEHLLSDVRRLYRLPDRRLSAAALIALGTRRWLGNVRELRHVLASAVLTAASGSIVPSDLPIERMAARERAPTAPMSPVALAFPAASTPTPEPDGHVLRVDSIRRALRATGGHRGRAAQLLGISRSTLYRRLEDYAIDATAFDWRLPPADGS